MRLNKWEAGLEGSGFRVNQTQIPAKVYGLHQKARGDEVTPIVQYMVAEMNRNASSASALTIRNLNQHTYGKCLDDYFDKSLFKRVLTFQNCRTEPVASKVVAYQRWAFNVRQGGDWDHKSYIRQNFTPAVPPGSTQEWHKMDDNLFYYDIWSNIHYGYVGHACGFSSPELLNGAGLEQIISDLGRFQWPHSEAGVPWISSFDDPSDRTSIEIGFNMYPDPATAKAIKDAVLRVKGLNRKPFPKSGGH